MSKIIFAVEGKLSDSVIEHSQTLEIDEKVLQDFSVNTAELFAILLPRHSPDHGITS